MVAQLELAEDEFITGEIFDRRGDGSFLRLYPTVERVATKYGIPPRILAEIAARNDWERQRERFTEEVKNELRSQQAKVKSVRYEEVMDGIDRYLRKWMKAVEEDDVRVDSFNDIDKALRLKEFLKGNVESRKETRSILSLAEIQARHRATIEDHGRMIPEVTGVVEVDSDAGTDGVIDGE